MSGNWAIFKTLTQLSTVLLSIMAFSATDGSLCESGTVFAASATNHTVQIGAPGSSVEGFCNAAALQSVAATLSVSTTVKNVGDGPKLTDGARFVPAKGDIPAYCQITGSFVTNAQSGKTSNFLAVFPEKWNGKYLQIGCSGHCGNFFVSDPTTGSIVITNQGAVGESIIKGYASFSTDEGHEGMAAGTWAVKGPGKVDQDALDDFYYRADKVLAGLGREFIATFYTKVHGSPQKVLRTYFIGCSGGGRDALVAAAFFPEEYDGIIAGSPYAEMARGAFQFAGDALAEIRSPEADVPQALLAKVDPIVKAKCDALDGVKDGLIQNPAACDFKPERDLPVCSSTTAKDDTCFSKTQIETISILLSAVTDEHGNVVQPGYTVSELAANPHFLAPLKDPAALELAPDGSEASSQSYALGNAALKVFVHQNDPEFHTRSVVSFKAGGPGQITNFHLVVPQAEVAKAQAALSMAVGAHPEKLGTLIKEKRKLLIWANSSDQTLTPYMSVNYYKELAKRYGGYSKLQENVRLFMLPGTGHCSMFGCGPQNFDPLSAMEAWVEQSKAPDALVATQFEVRVRMGSPSLDLSKPTGRTMPLCKFPEMAHYSGSGDVMQATNWSCPANDRSMLKVGESGRQAGVLE